MVRNFRFPTRLASKAPGTRICVSCGSKVAVGRYADSMLSIPGGDKTGDNRFYETMIPVADRLYDDYLKELKREGVIK